MKRTGYIQRNNNKHTEVVNPYTLAFQRLNSIDHPYLLKVSNFDEKAYEYEHIDGALKLWEWINQYGDFELIMEIQSQIASLYNAVSKISCKILRGSTYVLTMDDMNCHNIVVSPSRQVYIIDYEQFIWVSKHIALEYANQQMMNLGISMRLNYNTWLTQEMLKSLC